MFKAQIRFHHGTKETVDVEIYKQTNKYGQVQELTQAHADLADTVVMSQVTLTTDKEMIS